MKDAEVKGQSMGWSASHHSKKGLAKETSL